jgi:hypothetical protein
VTELSPAERLARYRAVEAWLEWQLAQTRRTIADLEQQAQQAPARYVIERKIRENHPQGAIVHLADCTMPERATRPVDADDARQGLTRDGQFFHACEFCSPDKTLGLGG